MNNTVDAFGDRMKAYEKPFTSTKLDYSLPVYARLDGRAFSKFTSKMVRPFDERMSNTMISTMEKLVKETKADHGYTQSDEISLIWYPKENENSGFMFDGKIQKIASNVASLCTAFFIKSYIKEFGQAAFSAASAKIPSFDCRVITLPSIDEAKNMVRWRQQDAFKNAVQSAAHAIYGHSKLMGKKTTDKIRMMDNDGYDFFVYPEFFKFGTNCEMRLVEKYLTDEELAVIPEDKRPEGPVMRKESFLYWDTWPELQIKKSMSEHEPV